MTDEQVVEVSSNDDYSSYSRVGPKGQIVISKRLREKYAILPGKQVEQIETRNGVLIKPARLVQDWKHLSLRVGKKWPKKVSSVQSIREQREK
jgi:AbrB family looped-hinge helix DNA binding protein